MSCIMMDPGPLAAIANATEAMLNSGFNYWGFDVPETLPRAARDLDLCDGGIFYNACKIYETLHRLNSAAYAGRYKTDGADDPAPDVDLTRYKVHHAPEYREHGYAVRPWHYKLAQLLDFWLCQTDEDATAKDPFRLGMQDFRNALYYFIVRNSPEYYDNQWGQL